MKFFRTLLIVASITSVSGLLQSGVQQKPLSSVLQNLHGPTCTIVFDSEGVYCLEDIPANQVGKIHIDTKTARESQSESDIHLQIFDSEGSFEL
mmetsp:Transcript_13810/g.20655  ORF Transcript_13810/g.20655 Transcript_13810/m.20655 type:complete len:94 (-) Transcript_13810:1505-1786(-)